MPSITRIWDAGFEANNCGRGSAFVRAGGCRASPSPPGWAQQDGWGLQGKLDIVNRRIILEGKWAETQNFVYLCIHLYK